MTDRYAVIGHPISHSKSPLIHKMFAEQTGQDISYEAIEAPLHGFASKIEELIAQGYKGCNVTVPFKNHALHLARTRSIPESVAYCQAANTLSFQGDIVALDNTDGIGIFRDIEKNHGVTLTNKRILLLGAGGASQGVVFPLLDRNPASLAIANRTMAKAHSIKALVERHRGVRKSPVNALEFNDLAGKQFDILINATSVGLTDSELPLPHGIFAPGALAYDMMYGRETPFMKFAREQGAAVVADGLGMLVEQAAEAFFIWRGVRPDTAPVLAALRG